MSWCDEKKVVSLAEAVTGTWSPLTPYPVPPLAAPATRFRDVPTVVVTNVQTVISEDNKRERPRARSQARLARARRVLAWLLGSFVAIHVAFVIALACRPTLGDPEYGYKLKRLQQHIQAAPDRPQVILLGTSRTELDFWPDAIPICRTGNGQAPLVFNMALRGASPLMNLCCLQRLLDQEIRPEWLLIEVLPPQLQGKELEESGALCLKNRLRWSDIPILEECSHAPWHRRLRVYRPLVDPWCDHAQFVAGQYLPRLSDSEWLRKEGVFWRHQDDHGWVPCPHRTAAPDHYKTATDNIRRNYAAPFTWTHVPASTDRILRAMIERCAAARIKVALVIMPESSEFRGWYSPATRQTIHDYLVRLTTDTNITMIDTSAWMADHYFADCHHLVPEGAAVFTQRFGREVLQPLLSGQPVPASSAFAAAERGE